MSESIEWIGGEHVVAKRAATPKIHNEIIEVCRACEEHLKAAGQDCRAGQPTPGNKAGGLSTLDEKSLGCIRKGGTRPIVEVLDQAQRPTKHGAIVTAPIAAYLRNLIKLYGLEEKPLQYTCGEIRWFVYRNANKIPMLTVGRVAGMTHANYPRESWIAYDEFLCRFSKTADGTLYYMGEKV